MLFDWVNWKRISSKTSIGPVPPRMMRGWPAKMEKIKFPTLQDRSISIGPWCREEESTNKGEAFCPDWVSYIQLLHGAQDGDTLSHIQPPSTSHSSHS